MTSRVSMCALLAVLCLPWHAVQAASIELQALLGDMVVLAIDGERHNLRVGESALGVTLVSVSAAGVEVEIDGRRQAVGLSQRVSTQYHPPDEKSITIPRNTQNQYLTTAMINGRSVQVMIDTGANVVALSAPQARSLGISDTQGTPSRVQTASGIVDARSITLGSISVGGIRVSSVEATVLQSEHPKTILLGMSYLRHVRIEEHNGIMSLSRVE